MSFEPLAEILQKTGSGIVPKKMQESQDLLTQFKTRAKEILPAELCDEFEIGYVKDGILRLLVTRAAVAQRLQAYKHQLIAAFPQKPGEPTITQILFQQKRS